MVNCIGHHGDTQPLPEPGLLLCAWHRKGLGTDLDAIVTLWSHLEELKASGGRGAVGSISKPGSRPPCDLRVVDITDHRGTVSLSLVGWARVVIEDRALAARSLDAEQAARLLAIHADWVAAQPWADEAVAEIHDAAMEIRRVCGDLPDPPIGSCPDIDPRGESDTCGGPLRWIDGTVGVRCSRCDGRWDSSSLIYLGRVSPINMWGSVPQIAEMVDASERTVRRWVSTGKVRKNTFGQVRHADVWHILQARSEPPVASTTEGSSTT